MWFVLTLFWHSLILVHQIILYRIFLRLHILFLYIYRHSIRISTEREDQYIKWGSHHIYNKADCVTTQGVSVWNKFSESVRQSYDSFYYIITRTITISSINFSKLGYFQNWSIIRLTFRRQHLGLISVIANYWSYSFEPQLPTVFMDLMSHEPR